MKKEDDDCSDSLSSSIHMERRKKWAGSLTTMDTLDSSISPSIGSETSDDTEDYFTKFNALSGWQLLVLVQFQLQTRIFIIIGIYLGYLNCVIDAASALSTTNTLFHDVVAVRGIIYAFDLFYFLDVINMLIYKNKNWQSITVRYKPRHGLLIFIEILSVIPLEIVYTTMIGGKTNSHIFYCLRLRYALRWCRVHDYYTRIIRYVDADGYILHLIIYLALLSVLVVTFGSMSYVYECRTTNITCADDYDKLFQHMYICGCKFYMTGILPETENKFLYNVFFSLAPYLFAMYFTSYFIIDILQTVLGKFVHMHTFTWLFEEIAEWKNRYKKEWKSYYVKYELLVKQFSDITWAKTKGFPSGAYLGRILPPIMYKELYLDISWAPLKHSHLFRDEDVFFLRELSSLMEFKYLSPGEIIYKRNQFKGFMVYVISGVIEILSEEDGETPIFSLASGTCLGESTMGISYPSSCTVIAKDTCDVAILHRKDMLKLYKTYPMKVRRIINQITNRYKYAAKFRNISLYQHKKLNTKERLGIITTKWVKLTLRRLLYGTTKFRGLHHRYYLQNLDQYIFCSKYLNLLVKAEEVQLITDSVFLKNKFPFIFKPNSLLLNSWDVIVLVMLTITAISFPYYLIFQEEVFDFYVVFYQVVTVLWLVDLYLKSSTAFQTHIYVTNMQDIIAHRITDLTYLLDLISVIPLEFFVYIIDGDMGKITRAFLYSNRLLKVYRIHLFFRRINVNLSLHIFLQYVQYGIYLSLLIYYAAAIFHVLGDREKNSGEFTHFLNDFAVTGTADRLIICLATMVNFVGTTGTMTFPFVGDWQSCVILVLLQIAICIFYLLFTASVASDHRQMEQRYHNKAEFLRYLEITMRCFHFDKKLQERIWTYARLQLNMNDVYFLLGSINHILYYFPKDLVMMTHNIAIGDHIRNQPLFFDLDEVVLAHICSIATYELIPMAETIIDTGGIYKEIYILANGVCSVSYLNKRSRTVYSGECLSAVPCFLNIPSLITVRALTTCKIITINVDKLKAVFLRFPDVHEIFKHTVEQFNVSEITITILAETITEKKEEISLPAQRDIKYFGYYMKKRTKKYYMFHEGFPKRSFLLKYLLLRHTFYCNGRFVFYWEVGRVTCALLTCLLFPFTVLYVQDLGTLRIILYFLDVTAYLDIYIRHHFSYFNENGLEVYHPYYTARYYWKHSFLTDLLACFPFDNLALLADTSEIKMLYFLNKLLQLYRYTAFCQCIFRDKMRFRALALMLCFLPYLIIALNVATAFTFVTFCDTDYINGEVEVICDYTSWIGVLQTAKDFTEFQTYVFISLFPISGFSLNSISLIKMHSLTEIAWFSIVIIVCIFLHVFLIANLIATSLTINTDLNSYQEAMHDMVEFMSYQKIEKIVRREVVNHFEYMWYKTRGKSIHVSFEPFKSSFKVEALYDIYGARFKKSSIFPAPNQAFFKSLLLDVKHEIYLKTGILYSVNDVHGNMYLLLKGRVEVVGADYNKLLTLTAGSLFGNLDNTTMGRSTLSMVASGHVEVLKFPSVVFHAHLRKFPTLRKHFLKLIVFNVDYLEEHLIPKTDAKRVTVDAERKNSLFTPRRVVSIKQFEQKRLRVFHRNKLIQYWENVILNMAYIIEYPFQLYFLSTYTDNVVLILFLYMFDLLCLVKIFVKFHTIFEDEFGQAVDSKKEIALNYMKQSFGFYFDVGTIIPFELVCLFFLSSPYYIQIWAVCRCNRLCHIIPLMMYLRKLTQKLNINVLMIKSLFLLTKVILAQVTLGSIVQIMRATKYDTAYDRFTSYCDSLMMVINACWRFPFNIDVLPTKTWVVVTSLCIILTCKYMTWHFIAETCGILYVVNRTHHAYAEFLIFMKRYMASEHVSTPLNERVTSYIELLWAHKRGILFPRLLDEAPYYLKEAVLNSMFGFHITEHKLLKHCHKDMSRQMASHMKTLVFFPGDVVAYIGDIDDCMYFIHEGEIQVLSEDTLHSEVVDNVLYSGDMFGLDQGMYEGCGHEFTYKAAKYSLLVYLKKNDWIHLLHFFPASRRVIYDKTECVSTGSEDTY